MGFDEEWGLLRARATEQQGTAMRLNGDLEINSQFTPLLKPLSSPYMSGLNGL